MNSQNDNLSLTSRLDYHLTDDTVLRGFARYTFADVGLPDRKISCLEIRSIRPRINEPSSCSTRVSSIATSPTSSLSGCSAPSCAMKFESTWFPVPVSTAESPSTSRTKSGVTTLRLCIPGVAASTRSPASTSSIDGGVMARLPLPEVSRRSRSLQLQSEGIRGLCATAGPVFRRPPARHRWFSS